MQHQKLAPYGLNSVSDGFTLVESVVLIGALVLLTLVLYSALPGVLKAGRCTSCENCRDIVSAEVQYAVDHDNSFPDRKDGDAANVARLLLAGGYVASSDLFYIVGSEREMRYRGPSAKTAMAQKNISWDFAGMEDGTGVGPNAPSQLPVVWSSAGKRQAPDLTPSGIVVVTLSEDMPFSTIGVQVGYHAGNVKFVESLPSSPNVPSISVSRCRLTDPTYPGCPHATVLSGGG